MIELLAQTCLNAVYAASYISLVAVGLVLIFGVMGVINFAHGELFMAGAYAVVTFYADLHLPFLVAVALGLVFVGCLGLLMERALFRPLRDNPLGGLVASIGFLMILQALAVLGYGVRMEHIPPVTQEVIVPSASGLGPGRAPRWADLSARHPPPWPTAGPPARPRRAHRGRL